MISTRAGAAASVIVVIGASEKSAISSGRTCRRRREGPSSRSAMAAVAPAKLLSCRTSVARALVVRSGHSLSASKASNGPLLRRSVQCRPERSRFVLKAAVSFVNAACLRRGPRPPPAPMSRLQSWRAECSRTSQRRVVRPWPTRDDRAAAGRRAQSLHLLVRSAACDLGGEEAPDCHRRELTRTGGRLRHRTSIRSMEDSVNQLADAGVQSRKGE